MDGIFVRRAAGIWNALESDQSKSSSGDYLLIKQSRVSLLGDD